MKWKIYQVCSWYNLIAILGFCCLAVYFFSKEGDLDDLLSLLLGLMVLFIVVLKNWMGVRFYQNIREKQTHRDRTGLFFYFLWLFNVICVIGYMLLMYDTLKNFHFEMLRYRSVLDLIMMSVSCVAIPTFLYTIILDIPIERKARKHIDFSEDLLQSQDHY